MSGDGEGGRVDVPVLDDGDGEVVTWWVYEQDNAARAQVTGCQLVVLGGALVLRDGQEQMLQAWGPGTWGSVQRVPVEEQRRGRH